MILEMLQSGSPISGKWYNKRTGESIIVRDMIQDGDKTVIVSSIGIIPTQEFSRDYIQMSDEVYDESGQVTGKETVSSSDFVPQPQPMLETPSQAVQPQIQSQPEFTPIVEQRKVVEKKPKANSKDETIGKVLDGNLPTINPTIVWNNIPSDGIQALIKYFGVSFDEIVDYIIKHIEIDKILLKENLVKNYFPDVGVGDNAE